MEPTWQTDDGRVRLWLASSDARAHVGHVARFAAVASVLCYSLREIVSLRAAVNAAKVAAARVKPWVLVARRKFKILNSIVRLVAVDVVNQIVRRERAADMFFHDNAMLSPAVIDAVNLRRQNNVAFAVDGGSSAKVVVASPCLRGRLALEASATKNARLQQRPTRYGLLLSARTTANPFVVFVRPRVIAKHYKATKLATRKIGNFVHAAI